MDSDIWILILVLLLAFLSFSPFMYNGDNHIHFLRLLGKLSKISDVGFSTHSAFSLYSEQLSLMSSQETGTIRGSDQNNLRNQNIQRRLRVRRKG